MTTASAPEECFTVMNGWAFRYRVTSGGRRQILAFLLPGDPLGFPQTAQSAPTAVRAITDLQLCTFPRRLVADYARSSPDRLSLFETVVAREYGFFEDRLVDLGRRSATERIASLILGLKVRLSARGLALDDSMPFPLRQEHIADALGLTQVHVSRILKRLRGDGLIRIERRELTILDPERLLRAAGTTPAELRRAALGQRLWN